MGMSAREVEDWARFYEVEPWGSRFDNLMAGMVASAIVNCAPNRKRGSKKLTPSDFLLKSASEQRGDNLARGLSFLRSAARPKGEQ